MHNLDAASVDAPEPSACRKMWSNALMLLLDDALGLAEGPQWRLKMAQSLNWIGTADFHEVCALAGVDGQATAERFRRGDYLTNRMAQFSEVKRTLKSRGLL